MPILTHTLHRVCTAYSVSQLCFPERLCVGQEFKLVVRGKQFLLYICSPINRSLSANPSRDRVQSATRVLLSLFPPCSSRSARTDTHSTTFHICHRLLPTPSINDSPRARPGVSNFILIRLKPRQRRSPHTTAVPSASPRSPQLHLRTDLDSDPYVVRSITFVC